MSFSIEDYKYQAENCGRSQQFIDETVKYAENLIGKGLPVIFTSQHLCEYIGIHYDDFNYLIKHRSKSYKYYQIKKKSGGLRQIVVPFAALRRIQQYIQIEILSKVLVDRNANGFIKQRSIRTNAQNHVNKQAILNIDLFKFFDSISEPRVFGIFSSLGYAKNLAVDMAKLVTVVLPENYYIDAFTESQLISYRKLIPIGTAVLPQGAPTSPSISNIVLRRMDRRFTKLSQKHHLSYSRYADDITFSGEKENLPTKKLLGRIVREEGFLINWDKGGVYKKGRKQMVTGLTVSNGIHVPRKFKKEVNKHIYCCINFGVKQHLQFLKIQNGGLYKEWLLGKIFYIKSIERETADKMLIEFAKIEWWT